MANSGDRAIAPRRILRDPALQQRLDDQGFVLIPLLESDEIARLQLVHGQFAGAMDLPFFTTLWTNHSEYRQKSFEAIGEVVAPRLAAHLVDYVIRLANFAVRRPGTVEQDVALHQDWTFVDETRFASLTIWIPLIDVDAHNGCLTVVPRSNRLTSHLRPNGPHDKFIWPLDAVREELQQKYLLEIPLNAGEAILFYSSVLHGSRANRSADTRLAIAASFTPREATLLHCFRTSPDTVNVYEVPQDFYWREVQLGVAPSEHYPHHAVRQKVEQVSRETMISILESR